MTREEVYGKFDICCFVPDNICNAISCGVCRKSNVTNRELMTSKLTDLIFNYNGEENYDRQYCYNSPLLINGMCPKSNIEEGLYNTSDDCKFCIEAWLREDSL